MDFELPTEFDVIIVGTGLIESIVSAAASRIGKRVLHLDNNDYYGGLWASFSLNDIKKLDQNHQDVKETLQDLENFNEKIHPLGNYFFNPKLIEHKFYIPEETHNDSDTVDDPDRTETNNKPRKFTVDMLRKDSRKFCLDLAPKLQFARGDFVELLISSNIARYSEYRSVSRILTYLNGYLEQVPCSRSDVFSNNKVSVIEKRMLMKLFTSLDSEQPIVDSDKTFKTFLKEKKLTSNLVHYVLYAIAMETDETLCAQGIKSTKRFLNSLGRFGKTPFLFSMYGSGETPQAFCRMSAVFGGTYALNQNLHGIILDSPQEKFVSIVCGKQQISAGNLVISVEKYPQNLLHLRTPKSFISRGILITDKSVLDTESEHLSLLLYPSENGKNLNFIYELGPSTGTTLKNLYVVHLISRQVSSPQQDFQECLRNLFELKYEEEEMDKPKILWSCFFSIPDSNDLDLSTDVPENVHICPGPDLDVDYDNSVQKAKDIFVKMYPDLEFLPRAPNPEEIVIEEDETETEATKEDSKTGNI